jgi:O-antigen/teichoic acid export membrane protein
MSTKKNFTYSIILNLSTYVASLITFPYVSRVFNAELLGTVTFINQVIQYFMLFSMAGVMTIGTREIANCGGNRDKRSETYSSMLGLSVLITIVVILIYIFAVFFVPYFSKYKALFMIGSANIIFTTLQIEWLYRGIENFKYITIRNIAIRILYVIAIFLLIKDKDDFICYYILTIAVVVINAVINLTYSRTFVSFIFSWKLYKEKWRKLFKSFAIIGANGIMNSFYSTFNVVYLGIVCSKKDVGYYYVSNNIMSLCLGVISAFTLVMLPRMSSLTGEKNKNEFDRLLDKSFIAVFSTCIPLSIIILCYASNIVQLLSGNGYEPAILPLRIIAPIIFINSIAQILVYQVEMPLRKDKAILVSSIIGAAVGVALNLLIVQRLNVFGSAIVLCLSVLSSFLYNMYYTISHKLLSFPFKELFKTTIYSLPYIVIWFIVYILIASSTWSLIIGGCFSLLYWSILNRNFIISTILVKQGGKI